MNVTWRFVFHFFPSIRKMGILLNFQPDEIWLNFSVMTTENYFLQLRTTDSQFLIHSDYLSINILPLVYDNLKACHNILCIMSHKYLYVMRKKSCEHARTPENLLLIFNNKFKQTRHNISQVNKVPGNRRWHQNAYERGILSRDF